jgi:hypothetical protein
VSHLLTEVASDRCRSVEPGSITIDALRLDATEPFLDLRHPYVVLSSYDVQDSATMGIAGRICTAEPIWDDSMDHEVLGCITLNISHRNSPTYPRS